MIKNKFLLGISIFEIFRWIMIYVFFNFVKSFFDKSNIISGENLLWFGSTFFANFIFALSGILAFINFEKYAQTLKFWCFFKLILILYVIILLFRGSIGLSAYFIIFFPLDFFIFFYLYFLTKEKKSTETNDLEKKDESSTGL
jgi:hypothetical protein